MKSATWVKGNQSITGKWEYYRPSEHFIIVLDSKDPVTGLFRKFVVYGDKPEFNGWRILK